jgi:hypothetical protein
MLATNSKETRCDVVELGKTGKTGLGGLWSEKCERT